MSVLGKVAHQRWMGVVASLMIAVPAFASLNPNDTWYRPPTVTSYTLGPIPAGYSLLITQTVPNQGLMLGETTSTVWQKNSDQTLLFSYSVDTTGAAGALSGQKAIEAANVGGAGWTGLTISDAGSDTTGFSGTTDPAPEWNDGTPAEIHRSNLNGPGGSGQSPQWRFIDSNSNGTVIAYGNFSATVWFATNATTYSSDFIGYIGNGASSFAEVYVPVVPDPASLVLLSIATGGLALYRRRRSA